ncbi:hypothetical protein HK098_005619 [Nowakowskiella sp. JEL0407]|nr:hypothetical protein HK098_005619 [Nowakowskiella sp. JEL0407]
MDELHKSSRRPSKMIEDLNNKEEERGGKFKLTPEGYFEVLSRPELFEQLKIYSARDFCVENILFYEEYRDFYIQCVQEIKEIKHSETASFFPPDLKKINPVTPHFTLPNIPSPKILEDRMQSLYSNFIAEASIYELNIQSKSMIQVRTQFLEKLEDSTKILALCIFDEIRNEVIRMFPPRLAMCANYLDTTVYLAYILFGDDHKSVSFIIPCKNHQREKIFDPNLGFNKTWRSFGFDGCPFILSENVSVYPFIVVCLFILGPYVLWLLRGVEDNYLIVRDLKWLIIVDIPLFTIYLSWRFAGLSERTQVHAVSLWGGLSLVWHQWVTVITPTYRAMQHAALVDKMHDKANTLSNSRKESDSSVISFPKNTMKRRKVDIENEGVPKFVPVLSLSCYYKVLNDSGKK